MEINRARKNPNLGELLDIRIDSTQSLLPSLRGRSFAESEVDNLRRSQTHKLAMSHVVKGATLTRESKCFEAIQCFNRALNVDDKCVDAYVGRGAACAGNNNFNAAIADFDRALDLQPNHKNAKRYKIEVLIAVGKDLEKNGSAAEAIEKYRLVEELSGPEGNTRAAAAIQRLSNNGRRRSRGYSDADVIDLSDDEEITNGNGSQSRAKRIPSEDAEANRKKLREMEEFIHKLKASK